MWLVIPLKKTQRKNPFTAEARTTLARRPKNSYATRGLNRNRTTHWENRLNQITIVHIGQTPEKPTVLKQPDRNTTSGEKLRKARKP
jgi:hypothetical protein